MFRKGTVESLVKDIMESMERKAMDNRWKIKYPLDLDEVYEALKEAL